MRATRVTLISWLIALLVLLPIFTVPGVSPASAHNAKGIPIRVLALIDEEYPATSSHSDLFQSAKTVLDVNKIPFDTLDVSQIDKHTFLDESSQLRYSVLLALNPGWRTNPTNSGFILDAVEKGMGAVNLLPELANPDLMTMFGMDKCGTQWLDSPSVQVIKDKFTFSYEGETIYEDFLYLDHELLPGAEVVANFGDSSKPAIWTYKYGAGKTVFHNHNASWIYKYQGMLLQSILYAMPIGVACPINAGVIEVDDCPRAFYSAKEVQDWHYTFYYNFKQWLQTYNFTASFFTAFSYSGNIEDFWVHPESLQCANDIITSGYELGLHCGNKHAPLDVAYWGSEASIDAEVDEMMQTVESLQDRLRDKYGTQLGKIASYIAPMSAIGNYGYEALDKRTYIRYVGTGGLLSSGGDTGTESIPSSGPDSADYTLEYPPTLKDFGREKDLDIYNLPRVKGDFYSFNQPQDDDYSKTWNILRSIIESGDSYIIFTHPDELDLLDQDRFPNASMPKLFEAFRVWGDYVSRHYPFYRWWTSSELGQYLEKREGALDAEWFPEESILKLKLSQPDDVIHIKTHEYLKNISQGDEALILAFSSSPSDYKSDEYDVVNVGHDYFIYPKGSESSMPVIPETSFTFTPVPAPVEKTSMLPFWLTTVLASLLFAAGLLVTRKISRKPSDTTER